MFIRRDNSCSEYHGRKYPIQPKLMRNSEFWQEILSKSFALLYFALRFFSHQANFNEIFGRKMSKSLTISPENNPCIRIKEVVILVSTTII